MFKLVFKLLSRILSVSELLYVLDGILSFDEGSVHLTKDLKDFWKLVIFLNNHLALFDWELFLARWYWVARLPCKQESLPDFSCLLLFSRNRASHSLSEEAANTPDVYLTIVVLKDDYFRSPIPSRHNRLTKTSSRFFRIIFRFLINDAGICHTSFLFSDAHYLLIIRFLNIDWSGHSKVANLDLTLRVDQNISWLYISVHNICWVQKVYSAQNVIKYYTNMLLLKNHWLVSKQCSEIIWHFFHYHKKRLKIVWVSSNDQLLELRAEAICLPHFG